MMSSISAPFFWYSDLTGFENAFYLSKLHKRVTSNSMVSIQSTKPFPYNFCILIFIYHIKINTNSEKMEAKKNNIKNVKFFEIK